MYTQDPDDDEEEETISEVIEPMMNKELKENEIAKSSEHPFESVRKLSRQFSDNFIDMFKVGDSFNLEQSSGNSGNSNEEEKQDSSETSSTSENVYTVNPSPKTGDGDLVRPSRPSLSQVVPILGTDWQGEQEEDDLFLSAEDLLAQALHLDDSKKIIGGEEEEEEGGQGADRISKYRVCDRISEASEESSLELVVPQNQGKELVVFSNIFTSEMVGTTNEENTNLNDGGLRKESTSSILPDIRDMQSQMGDLTQDECKKAKTVKEIDLLDEDTMTSVEINQLFDDELKQVGEIKQGLSQLSHTLVTEAPDDEGSQGKLLEGRSLRQVLRNLGTRGACEEEEVVFPAKEALRRTTSDPLFDHNEGRKEGEHVVKDLEALEVGLGEEEEQIRPILKKRTRSSLSESGSQTEISAVNSQPERSQVRFYHASDFSYSDKCKQMTLRTKDTSLLRSSTSWRQTMGQRVLGDAIQCHLLCLPGGKYIIAKKDIPFPCELLTQL